MMETKRTEKREKSEALILFSRLPIGSETKTRLSPLLDERQREALHRSFWADAFAAALELRDRADLFLYWTGSGRPEAYSALIPAALELREQRGRTLGGGYWLIGLKRAIPELFDISAPWGSGGVRLGTLERARELGCVCAETDSYRDLDTPDDLHAFLEERHPYGSATRACLEGLLGGGSV